MVVDIGLADIDGDLDIEVGGVVRRLAAGGRRIVRGRERPKGSHRNRQD